MPPPTEELLIDPDELDDLVVQEVGQTALFGSRFRENAGRALLIPRRRPGERTPLWQQRLKAQSLLQVARRYPAFPIVLETYRECLQDVFDLPALKRLLQGLRTRQIDLVDVETPSASPYSASLLFDYVATYMYEDDTPPAERRAQALSLDRDLLRELLGQEELRDLIDPGALEDVEAQLRGDPRTPDELHDVLTQTRRFANRRICYKLADSPRPSTPTSRRGTTARPSPAIRASSSRALPATLAPTDQASLTWAWDRMNFGRFVPDSSRPALAGSLARRNVAPHGLGTPGTDTPTFVAS